MLGTHFVSSERCLAVPVDLPGKVAFLEMRHESKMAREEKKQVAKHGEEGRKLLSKMEKIGQGKRWKSIENRRK